MAADESSRWAQQESTGLAHRRSTSGQPAHLADLGSILGRPDCMYGGIKMLCMCCCTNMQAAGRNSPKPFQVERKTG